MGAWLPSVLLLTCTHVTSVRWFSLVEPRHAAAAGPAVQQLALYPLPAVYLPGSSCTLRNIEPRNIAMAQEQTVFVASLLAGDRRCCAEVGVILGIDDVQAATADSSGQVLASATSNVLMVQCTVLGRVELLSCDNLDAWRTRETYLLANVCEYADDEGDGARSEEGSEEGSERKRALDVQELKTDVEDAIYRLIDAVLLEADSADGATGSIDATAAVASLEDAASHVASGRWWEALELWQRHCATRAFALQAQHQADRNEFVIDCKLREGGVLRIPVQEFTLCDEDRLKLMDLDARAKEALEQVGLDDAATFQACLEARSVRERATLLHAGVLREAERLDGRAALQRALGAS